MFASEQYSEKKGNKTKGCYSSKQIKVWALTNHVDVACIYVDVHDPIISSCPVECLNESLK